MLFTSGKAAKKKCFQSGLIIRTRTLSVVLIKSLFIHFFQLPHLLFNKTMSDFQYQVSVLEKLLKDWCVYVLVGNSAKYIKCKLLGKFKDVVNGLCEFQCYLRRRIFI